MSMVELEEAPSSEVSYRMSLSYINQALEQECKPQYLAHKATLLFLLSNEKESMLCFRRALSFAMPPAMRAEIYNNYACLLAKSGNPKEAFVLFERLEKDKHYLTPQVALVNQAKIHLENHSYQQAKIKLLRSIHLAPDYVDAHYYLSVVAFLIQEYDEAFKMLEKTIELEPSHRAAHELLARVKMRQ